MIRAAVAMLGLLTMFVATPSRADNNLEEVRSGFDKFLVTGDRKAIQDFKLEDLEYALLREIPIAAEYDSMKPRYRAMEQQIEALKREESGRRAAADKWKDRWISFGLGILSAVALMVIKKRMDQSAG